MPCLYVDPHTPLPPRHSCNTITTLGAADRTMGAKESRTSATRHVCVAQDGAIYGKECSYCNDHAYEHIVANDDSGRSFLRCRDCWRRHPDWYYQGYTWTCPTSGCKICGTRPPPNTDDSDATMRMVGEALLLGIAKHL
ncbi:hypothetical protein TW95_gp0684 [Pandoravirus inopinatum]|uniref:Uncharacterized protein n=1 Tax=Pandoravirus inopinatum TaxID=1605721 RepID=A0A0B5IXD5_9VIRU|nr:hypothetical protein TW95_gp0684 [Pandoravirus inopinatum]AJF97418.1 hypothetical protein [Pandoravirus inopinatum]